MFSATFAGIAPSSVPTYIGAQVIGGVLAIGVIRALYPGINPAAAAQVTVPRNQDQPPAIGQASSRGGTFERAADG